MIFTFYSYKGGVGRSMALANIAELFYQYGLKVLMIDWDLEAPGLERYFPVDSLNIPEKPGLMDMLLDYKSRMAQELNEGVSLELGDPRKYLVDIYPTKGGSVQEVTNAPNSTAKGKLWLLPAGKRSKREFGDYVKMVLSFDWDEFYHYWEGELYFDWLRKQFEEIADIVLIDSRTGVTEMGGVCTHQMADTVVAFCAPNRQNIEGTYEMVQNLTNKQLQDLRYGRALNVLVIPARVERAESELLDQFHDQFVDLFQDMVTYTKGFVDIEQLWQLGIPYIPKYAFTESVAVREAGRASAEDMSQAFRRLREMLWQIMLSELANSKPREVAYQLAGALAQVDHMHKAELSRLASFIETLTDELSAYSPLLVFANSIAKFARGDVKGAVAQLSPMLGSGQQLDVAGVKLPIPKEMQDEMNKSAHSGQAFREMVIDGLMNYHDLEALEHSYLATLQITVSARRTLELPPALATYETGLAVRTVLDKALEELEDRLADAAHLLDQRFRHELPLKEISKRLGLRAATLYVHQERALTALTTIVAQQEANATEIHRLRRRTAYLPAPTYQTLIGVEDFITLVSHEFRRGVAQRGYPLVITGLGGIGKTSLALEATLRWLNEDLPPIQQVLFVKVDSSKLPGGPSAFLLDQVLITLGDQLDLPLSELSNNEQRIRLLVEHLTYYPCLLLLDNIEMPNEVTLLMDLVTRLAKVAQILITSRCEFHHPTVVSISLGELSEENALTLLQDETQRLGIPELSEGSRRKIYTAVGGHPLALKLVAGQVGKLPLEYVLNGLYRSSSVADDLYTRVYDRSWALLSPVARNILLGLLLLPMAGANWDDLQEAVKGSGLTADDQMLERAVQQLSELNFLQISSNQDAKVYSLHRLTYSFLEQKIGLLDYERASSIFAMQQADSGYASTAEPRKISAGVQILLRQMRHYVNKLISAPVSTSGKVNSDTLLTLLSRCQRLGDMDNYVKLLEKFGNTLQKNSHLGLLDQHLEAALGKPDLNNQQRVKLASLRVRLLVQLGNQVQAEQVLQDVWPAADTPLLQADLYNREGVLLEVRSEYESSQERYKQALELAESENDLSLVTVIYNNLGNWAYAQNRDEEALRYYTRALEIAKQLAHSGYCAMAEGGLAMTLDDLGQYDKASRYHTAARAHYEQAGNLRGLVRTDLNLSYRALERGKYREAKELANRALKLAQQLGDLDREGRAWHNLGRANHMEGAYESAVDCLLKAREKRRWLGQPLYEQGTLKQIKLLVQELESDKAIDPVLRAHLLQRCYEALKDA
ncbi:MAG: KGGVGR-motif variant AAA ATPase [Ardenticatenaceae bacterium]